MMAYDMPVLQLADTAYLMNEPAPGAIRIDPDGGCVTVTLRPGDQASYDRVRRRPYERAELISRTPFAFGRTSRISFYQYIAPGSRTQVPTIIGQVHNSAEQGERPLPPIMAMELDRGVQRIVTRSVAEKYATAMPPRMIRWTAPATLGVWVHWEWDITPDPVRGHLRIRRDGVVLVDQDMPLGYRDARGPYWQFGIYRPRDTSVVRVAYGGVRIAPGRPEAGGASSAGAPRCAVAPLPQDK